MNIEQYQLEKLMYTIIFDNSADYTNSDWIGHEHILNSLKIVLEYLTSINALDYDSKNNVYSFLMSARKIENSNKNLINEIVKILNNQVKDESICFYRAELYKRRRDYRYLLKYTDDEIIEEKINLYDSICHDITVLMANTDDTDDKTFNSQYLPIFANNYFFFESINAILKEYPELFNNKTFYNRTVLVLNETYKKNKCRDIYKGNKAIIKEIKSKTKKYK